MNIKKIILTFVLFILSLSIGISQKPKNYTSGDIHEMIQKLGVLGTVVYVAAHPDDENTSLISYLANERKYDVIYLSMTRGDGGQNLIGPEIREQLGLIRTQELLAARRIDGGKQWFSRANDFGYSKNPQETFKIWDKEEILKDVVWAMRLWKPDVLINRFDHRPGRPNHGHHTASAILSVDAFDKIGDPSVFPDQLNYVDPWKAQRIFLNTSWWFYGSREAFDKADKSNMYNVDIGVYYPIKGKSNTEISAASRSMHKCQGFGRVGTRGSEMEYMELLKGSKPTGDFMEGINTTWSRVPGGEAIGKMVADLEQRFDYANPSKAIPQLIKIKNAVESLPPSYWVLRKSKEVEQIIEKALGLFVEGYTDDKSVLPGTINTIHLEAINRSDYPIVLKKISTVGTDLDTLLNLELGNNKGFRWDIPAKVDEDIHETNPYWINEKPTLGRFTVNEQTLVGKPETDRPIKVYFHMEIDGESISFIKDIVHKRRDPVRGEIYEPLQVIAPAYINMKEGISIFNGGLEKTVGVTIKSGTADLQGKLSLNIPAGWSISPTFHNVSIEKASEEKDFSFDVIPPSETSEGLVTVNLEVGDQTYNKSWTQIQYDHIPTQTVMKESSAKWVNIDLKKVGSKIGYIIGAGDDIPKHLRQVGYNVSILEESEWNLNSLKQYDAVILGIRAYNTLDRLNFYMDDLFEYTHQGGTVIVQYNTSRGIKVDEVAPYPLKLSRDRVTVEEAPVQILAADHPVMNYPNKITQADFDGWVQERGLYFPNEWDEHFIPILACNDPGESSKKGGLLIAEYGEGYFVYSGMSWFREMPAGVAGAYRIFANMIALGNVQKP